MPEQDSPPRGTHRKVWLRRFAVASVSSALALGLGECLARWHASATGGPHDAQRARDEVWLLANGLSADLREGRVEIKGAAGDARVMLHPYLGFDSASGLEQYESDLRKALLPEAQDAFDVLLLGGSVAAIVGVEAGDALTELLASDPRLAGREVRLQIYARGAFKQPQQVMLLSYLLNLGLEPDAVINIDGYNELTVNAEAWADGVNPIQPLVHYWGTVLTGASDLDPETLALRERGIELGREGRTWCRRFAESHLDRSALASLVARALARLHRARAVEVQDAYSRHLRQLGHERSAHPTSVLHGPRPQGGEPSLQACVRMWAESSSQIRAICTARGIPYVHVLQPTLHDEGSKPLTDEERRTGTLVEELRTAAREGYPMLRERGRELAEAGESYLDASRLFEDVHETLYYDPCHFRGVGCVMLARAAAERLLQALP